MNKEPINIISLGAGVQSSCMALMAARGEFKDLNGFPIIVTAAIFADTQAEPEGVMNWLNYLEIEILKCKYSFPIYRVTAGSLEDGELRVRTSQKTGKRYLKNSIPAFVKSPSGKTGLLGRKCTSDYKIIPLQRKVKEILGIKRASKNCNKKSIMWIGISTDEAHRMKPSRVNYIENTFPLIDAKMSRKQCLNWMKSNNYPEPPRSACVFCPFHGDEEWERLKKFEPKEFERAAMFELKLQAAAKLQNTLLGMPFLHSTGELITKIDFNRKKPGYQQVNLFGNECEGMCGV